MGSLSGSIRFLAAPLALVLIAQACGGSASAPSASTVSTVAAATAAATQVPTATVNVGVQASTTYAPYWIAKAKDLFGKHQISVNETLVQSGAASYAAMASGSLDIIEDATSQVLVAASRGEQVKALATSTCVVLNSIGVRTGVSATQMADLKGKRVGVTAFGSAADIVTRYLLRQAGLDPDKDVQMVALTSATPAYLAAFRTGQVDAAFLFPPSSVQIIEQEHLAKVIVDLNASSGPTAPPPALSPGSYCTTFIGSVKFASEKKDVAKRFVDAIKEADAFLNDKANLAEATKLLVDQTKADEASVKYLLENTLGGWKAYLPPKSVENIQTYLNGSGVVTPKVNVTYAQVVDADAMGSQ